MCGIAGYCSKQISVTLDVIEKMTRSMAHRGPDAEGYYSDEYCSIGHRRLSIIDLSEKANQPMFSGCGRYIIILNGEIYNFQEIAKELKINFRTHSDTEVAAEAFVKWGTNFVEKLIGMFAIAIYDTAEKTLYLFRDRLGIKPLFYFHDNKVFAFASEPKALLQNEYIRSSVNISKPAINEYLHLGFIPQPKSIWGKIYKFPSGHYGMVKNNKFDLYSYWKPEEKISAKKFNSLGEAKQMLNDYLIRSVKYRLISDVPYGVFLSGGIDSSVICAVAAKIATPKLKTFTIGFDDKKYNEANHARKIAEYLGTEHHEFIVSYTDAINLIETLPDIYDEPNADSSAIPTMLVSKMARQYVKMVLSGDGGDELFHGYGAYIWAEKLSGKFYKTFRKPLASGLSLLPSRYKRIAHLVSYPDEANIHEHIFSQEQYLFTSKEIQHLLKPGFADEIQINQEYVHLSRILAPAERQALFDLNYYLKDDLLVKVDRASMKYSLEARVPMLDHNLVEFALNLSREFKIKNGVQKYILKELLYDYLPKQFFMRPKWGFAIPLAKWLRNELKFLFDKYLSQNNRIMEIADYNYIDNLKKCFFNKAQNYLYNRLWLLIVLSQWLEKNNKTNFN
ncbi:MAG: asparagine synthase (glutamine-hydrolyzing) [Bacteroidia bacterium]|nr:asparagine synthase (glutamine-hydrolyzing) [Bacteroidia bacterium]